MLRPLHGTAQLPLSLPICNASWPVPFAHGLEYNSPAHGTWNIVHMGMNIPGSHQIYVCAPNCNRGVVLTAAEMNALDRFSTIFLEEHNLIDGDMEELIIEGVTDILGRLPHQPSCVLLFTVCVHHFLGTDIPLIYRTLRERFPKIPFVECYMDPIKQKGDRSPDQFLRRAMCDVLSPHTLEDRSVSFLGSDFPLDDTSDLLQLLRAAGYKVRQQPACADFEEYLSLAESALNVFTYPNAVWGMEHITRRLGTEGLYLPACFGYEEIERHLTTLAQTLGVPPMDTTAEINACEDALRAAKSLIGDTPIVLDHTFHPRPLGLARLLLEHGFRVERVYLDAFSGEEREDFIWLQAHTPQLELYPTIQARMRTCPRTYDEKVLAIGQKAAYFTRTPYFVNLVQGAGLWGFDGIRRVAALMMEAYTTEKDPRALISRKGWGCTCCL